jgi:hypothetical protein
MSQGPRRFWFPAKRHGWGWGPPSAWQGWAVLVTYLLLVLLGIPLVQVSKGSAIYLVYAFALTVLLIAVCFLKGEPPQGSGRDRNT